MDRYVTPESDDEAGEYTDVERPDGTRAPDHDDQPPGEYTDAEHDSEE